MLFTRAVLVNEDTGVAGDPGVTWAPLFGDDYTLERVRAAAQKEFGPQVGELLAKLQGEKAPRAVGWVFAATVTYPDKPDRPFRRVAYVLAQDTRAGLSTQELERLRAALVPAAPPTRAEAAKAKRAAKESETKPPPVEREHEKEHMGAPTAGYPSARAVAAAAAADPTPAAGELTDAQLCAALMQHEGRLLQAIQRGEWKDGMAAINALTAHADALETRLPAMTPAARITHQRYVDAARASVVEKRPRVDALAPTAPAPAAATGAAKGASAKAKGAPKRGAKPAGRAAAKKRRG